MIPPISIHFRGSFSSQYPQFHQPSIAQLLSMKSVIQIFELQQDAHCGLVALAASCNMT